MTAFDLARGEIPRSSALQLRLQRMSLEPTRPWINLVENVPRWPDPQPFNGDGWQHYSYAPHTGNERLRAAIADLESAKYRRRVDPRQIVVTNGGLQALNLVFRRSFHPGAVAVCQSPLLGLIHSALAASGHRVLLAPDLATASADALRERIGGSRVSLFYLNSPCNPTGEVVTPPAWRRISQIASSYQAGIVLNSVYDSYLFGGSRQTLAPTLVSSPSEVFIVNSMSKNYGVPGLRIGWIVTTSETAEALAAVQEHECIAVGGAAQEIACDLIARGNAPLVQGVRSGWTQLAHELHDLDGVTYSTPTAGTQLLLRLPVGDAEAFADHALEHDSLVLATGANYVGLGEGHVRMPVGIGCEAITLGIATLRAALATWPARSHSASVGTAKSSVGGLSA